MHASCPGVPDGSIDISVSGGMPNYSFLWKNNAGSDVGISEDLLNLRGGTYTVTVTDSKGCQQVGPPVLVNEPNPIDVNVVVSNTSIQNNDGAINITASGGNLPYSYNWAGLNGTYSSGNEDIFGLMPGYYYLTVTDNKGCNTKVDSILVEGVVFATANVKDLSCNGGSDGSIDITIMGGIPPFTYLWNDGLMIPDRMNLSVGFYTITITDNAGSQFVETYEIKQPNALTFLNVAVTNESGLGCNGGININVTGGTPPYSYQWSNGATNEDQTNLCKGKYDITVTDSKGCLLIQNDIEVLPAPLSVDASVTNADCNTGNGSVTISMLGGCEPYKIVLNTTPMQMTTTVNSSHTFNNIPAGSYLATVTDLNNTTINTSFEISEADPIIITVDNVVNNSDASGSNCNGAISISVTGGMGPYTYNWSNGAMVEDVQGLCETISPYNVTVTDQKGCTAVSSAIMLRRIVIDVADIKCVDECNGEIRINVFPNGTYTYVWSDAGSGRIRTGLCADDYSVTIIDGTGNIINTSTILVDAPAAPLMVTLANSVQPTGTNKNGSIDINVSGGWGNYMYAWTGPDILANSSEDQVGLGGGTYTVIVTDGNGCQQSLAITLDAKVLILGNVEAMGNPCAQVDVCQGTIEIDAVNGGIAPYSYKWSNNSTGSAIGGLCAGQYSVTITDAQGLVGVFGPFELTDPEPLALDYIKPGDCSATVLISGGSAPYQIKWNTPDGDTTAKINVNDIGPYAVLVTDNNGCTSIDNNVLVNCNDVNNPDGGICSNVRSVITPNEDAKNDEFKIECTENVIMHLEIYDRFGQLVFTSESYDNTWKGTDSKGNKLPEGGYFYVLEYDDAGVLRQEKGHISILR